MLKEKMRTVFKDYLVLLGMYTSLVLVGNYIIKDSRVTTNKSGLLSVVTSFTIVYLIKFIFTYVKNKDE